MFRLLILLALTIPASFSQISGLATTDTGGQLYFSTSLRLRGTHGNFDPKILRYVAVFQPFREVELQTPQQNPFTTNYFQLTGPQVSGDSTVVAYTTNAVCTIDSPEHCLGDVLQQGNIVGLSVASNLLNDGEIVLSGDKRYALMIDGQLVSSPRLIDLATGKTTVIANYYQVGDRQVFADDGSILLQMNPGQLVLWNPVSPVPLQLSQSLQLVTRLSRNRAKVVYEAVSAANELLIAYDVASGTETVLATAPPSNPNAFNQYTPYFSPWITNDGRTILFESQDSNGVPQAFLIHSDGSNLRQITHLPEGVSEAILSGYGNVAYAATLQARLVRIDVASGTVSELAPPSAQVSSISTPALGSLAQLSGHGLNAATAVYVNDQSLPIYLKSDTSAVFQVPWEASTATPAVIRVTDNSNSPFEGTLSVPLAAVSPSFLPFGTGYGQIPLAVHQHSSALVTANDPAVPGEIITLYMTGLGPVTGAVQTGVPAPLKPLERVVNPFTCLINFAGISPGTFVVNAPVLFAGLAPGLVGIYVVNMQVPAVPPGANPDSAILSCSDAEGSLPLAH
jgi:uncharacterized protein (TIGR03437 family)